MNRMFAGRANISSLILAAAFYTIFILARIFALSLFETAACGSTERNRGEHSKHVSRRYITSHNISRRSRLGLLRFHSRGVEHATRQRRRHMHCCRTGEILHIRTRHRGMCAVRKRPRKICCSRPILMNQLHSFPQRIRETLC